MTISLRNVLRVVKANRMQSMYLTSKNFSEAFQHLDLLLVDSHPLWSESAFVRDSLSWEEKYPALYSRLLALSNAELCNLENESELLTVLSNYLPALTDVLNWQILSPDSKPWRTPQRALFGLPERKKLQTEGFVTAALSTLDNDAKPGGIVDWCSGKGFLARQLHYASGRRVNCLEVDKKLCESGHLTHRSIDTHMAQNVVFHQQNVLKPIAPERTANAVMHTALHACGDLHTSMLEYATSQGVSSLACSPCCYHKIRNENYEPLSKQGQKSVLRPSKQELRLATAETSTASTLERKMRQTELLWRTAFDLRLRRLNNLEEYTPTPSVKKSLLKKSFQNFARSSIIALERQGQERNFFPLNESAEKHLLREAQAKIGRVKRLEKVQLGFRKALEYWLLLDRALYMQEKGYRVRLQEFCRKRDSGRNVVILGRIT